MNIIIHPPVDPIAIQIFNFKIYYYGIIMSLAIFTGVLLSAFLINKYLSKNDYNKFMDFVPISIISAIIGARIFYVIGEFSYYSNHIQEIIMINHGGLSIYGAILFGLISIYLQAKKETLKFCDFIALAMPLCQSIGRWGNFINQEAFGRPTNGIIKLFVDIQYRPSNMQDFQFFHPAFLYESILDFICFLILIIFFLKCKNIKSGTITFLYLILYSIIRMCVESLRVDSILSLAGLHIATIISITILIISLICLVALYRKN